MDHAAVKQIASNRKAYHDYFVEEQYEAGIELCGTEVKSIRMEVNLKDSFLHHQGRQMMVHGLHVAPMRRGISSTGTRCAPAAC